MQHELLLSRNISATSDPNRNFCNYAVAFIAAIATHPLVAGGLQLCSQLWRLRLLVLISIQLSLLITTKHSRVWWKIVIRAMSARRRTFLCVPPHILLLGVGQLPCGPHVPQPVLDSYPVV